MNGGTYLLVLKLEDEIEIRRPRREVLKPGFYIYVGSAMNSLTGRLKRHLTRKKKVHWHIDQLTEVADPIFFMAFVGKKIERDLSIFLSRRLEVIKGFGSSDLDVEGNLFHLEDVSSLERILKEVLEFFPPYKK